MRKINKEQFIERSNIKHNNYFDYSQVDYKNTKTKVTIGCPKHGLFQISPEKHMSGQGCSKCGRERTINSRKITREQFIERSNIKHNNYFDYSQVDYKNTKTKVTIRCPKHGLFQIQVEKHMSGQGCTRCTGHCKDLNNDDFIKKSQEKHGDYYDYSLVNYINQNTKVIIKCPKHREFEQLPCNHWSGKGCSDCKYEILRKKNNLGSEEFIKRAKQKHGNKYDYSLVNYINKDTKVVIKCPKHGEFKQTPHSHGYHGSGCPICNYCPNCLMFNTNSRLCEYCKSKSHNKIY